MGKGIFTKQSNSEIYHDPSEVEHFKNDQDDDEEYAGVDKLVRETIQNSIDAALSKNDSVRVRISLHSKEEMPPVERLAEYFERLKEPLKGDVSYTPNDVPDLDHGFLVCEDFGTRGLEGDPKLKGTPPKNERQDFFWFWRNIARSGKADDDLGRWGLGKTVYRAASKIGCMLGLTARESDKRKIVMGQAVIKIHKYGNDEFKPGGFWCNDLEKDSDVPLPIELPEEVARFQQEWKLSRTDEPGLSVVVPYVVKLTGKSIFQVVSANFFALILLKKLVVEIKAPDVGFIELTNETIENKCQEICWDGTKSQKRHVSPPIKFAQNCLAISEKAIASKTWGKGSNLSTEKLTFAPHEEEMFQEEFRQGHLVAAKIHIYLPKKDKQHVEDYFYVFLQKDDQKSPDSYYIREGMTITKINSTRARNNQTRGIVYIGDGPLASLLGDTEGPAHEDWQDSADRPEKIWQRGWKSRVKFVKKIVDEFYGIVSPPIKEADPTVLIDYFSLELDRKNVADKPMKQDTPTGTGGNDTGRDGNTTGEVGDEPFPISVPLWFQIQERAGGFCVSHNKTLFENIPLRAILEIQLAYDTTQGNPLIKWDPYDFDLTKDLKKGGRMEWKGEKLNAEVTDGQTIIFKNISNGFSFAVTGFDTNRDLYVKVIDKTNEN